MPFALYNAPFRPRNTMVRLEPARGKALPCVRVALSQRTSRVRVEIFEIRECETGKLHGISHEVTRSEFFHANPLDVGDAGFAGAFFFLLIPRWIVTAHRGLRGDAKGPENPSRQNAEGEGEGTRGSP